MIVQESNFTSESDRTRKKKTDTQNQSAQVINLHYIIWVPYQLRSPNFNPLMPGGNKLSHIIKQTCN